MIRAVFDTNLLVSAFLTRDVLGGVSTDLLRFAEEGAIQLHLSPDIIAEALATLMSSDRLRARYGYTATMAVQFCDGLRTASTIVVDPPPIPGAAPRDPDDDKIIACAVAAGVEYLVTRDRDLLSIRSYSGVEIIAPEAFLRIVRSRSPRP